MAIVSDGFTATLVLGAKNDKVRNVNYDLRAADYTEAVAAVTAIRPLLAAVSAGNLKGYNITAKAIDDAYVRPTDTDAEERDSARVTAYIGDNPFKKATFVIPMPKIGLFVAPAGENMDIIDIADTDLLAYKAIFEDGGYATISDGEDIGNLLRGKRIS